MIRLDMPQGSPEWIQARLGIPTASQFHRIITPRTMKPSASATGYIYELVVEWALGQPLDEYVSQFMERGTNLEDEAVHFYELQRGVDTEAVGFCLRDDGLAGCSPDRIISPDGGLEIKTPSAKVHVGYLIGEPQEEYKAQVQGCMWITGANWWDWVSYNPVLPSTIVRFYRDDEFIGALDEATAEFLERLARAKEKMLALGCVPAESPKKVLRADVPQEVTP